MQGVASGLETCGPDLLIQCHTYPRALSAQHHSPPPSINLPSKFYCVDFHDPSDVSSLGFSPTWSCPESCEDHAWHSERWALQEAIWLEPGEMTAGGGVGCPFGAPVLSLAGTCFAWERQAPQRRDSHRLLQEETKSWKLWLTPVIAALRRLRQGDCHSRDQSGQNNTCPACLPQNKQTTKRFCGSEGKSHA